MINLITALENDGVVSGFVGVYLREGEPYLKTAHCTMVAYWDGIFHYSMYLMMLAALSWKYVLCRIMQFRIIKFILGLVSLD